MGVSTKEIVTGRKTFFIVPDTTLIPEIYLEDFFSLGYECYYIEYDKRLNISKKIDIIISLFHDVIIFFNIDYNLPNIEWSEFIKKICNSYDNRTSLGVLYTKRQSKEDKAKIEQRYLFELGLNCGCVQLEYQKKQKFEIIEKLLYANQAQGRRKTIRALCTSSCTFSCTYQGNLYNGTLQDISLSHFSLVSQEANMPVKLYEKISDFHFNIRGFMFRSDAVLIMDRPINGFRLLIFAFVASNGANGLDQRVKQLLVPNLYKLMSSNLKNLLDQVYNRVGDNYDIGELQEIPEEK